MHTPIILLVGQAGSGKDTVAGFMVKNHGAIAVAHADPMKRLCALIFGFTEEQLWGSSEQRNAPDPRFDLLSAWMAAEERFFEGPPDQGFSREVLSWVEDLFPGQPRGALAQGLYGWFCSVREQTFYVNRSLTPRLALQTLGTEWGRAQGRSIWTDYTMRVAMELLGGQYRYDRTRGLVEDLGYTGPERVVITDGRFRNELANVLRVGGVAVRIDSSVSSFVTEMAGIAGHQSEAEQKGIPPSYFSAFFINDKNKGLDVCEKNVGSLVRILDSQSFTVRY